MSKGYLPIVDPSEEFTEEVQPLSDFAADALDRKNGADKAGRTDGANDLPLEEGKEYSGTDVSPLTAAGEGLPKTEAIRTAYEEGKQDSGQEWTPEDRKKPSKHQAVYVTCQAAGRDPWVAQTTYRGAWDIPTVNRGEGKVIAWMPLTVPAPYQGGKNG